MINLQDKFTDNINVSKQWLDDLKDYEIKILLLTGVLADNNLAFRGTLKTMCEWLGIKSCSINNKKIKQSLQNLSSNGYIFYKVEGRTHHISISNKGLKNKQIYKIRKIWIETFKNYCKENSQTKNNQLSVDWIKILRVFIYIYFPPNEQIFTLQKIAESTNTSIQTARKALIAILSCNLKGLHIQKEIVRDSYYDDKNIKLWRTRGQRISIFIVFNELQ